MNVKVPLAVGLPEIEPDALSRNRPGGRVPIMLHATGSTPESMFKKVL